MAPVAGFGHLGTFPAALPPRTREVVASRVLGRSANLPAYAPSPFLRAVALATLLAVPAGFAADIPKVAKAKAETAPAAPLEPTAPFVKLSDGTNIRLAPFGPTQADFDSLRATLPTHPSVAKWIDGTRWRILAIETNSLDENGRVVPATRYSVTFYDYSNQRVLVAEGAFNDRAAVTMNERKGGWQPNPSQEEFDEAVAALLADKTVGQYLASGDVTPYGPMPPVLEFEPGSEGKVPAKRRVVNVGLMPRSGFDTVQNQIIGVDLGTQAPLRYRGNAPETAPIRDAGPNCGVNSSGQSPNGQGVAGQYTLTVQDTTGATLWSMVVTRPSASSGGQASAIEVANVQYKGNAVMKRGHVPILNVQYLNNTCGPYRDWQYAEGQFATDGTGAGPTSNAANENIPNGSGGYLPGFRACQAPATTALENGTDTGNFKGVAIYRQGTETVLVTELNAGWYRYIHEWRFDDNGAIRPRFGFGATINSCTCREHYHHVYFRLDMDVDGTSNTLYEIPVNERRSTELPDFIVQTEKKVLRNPATPTYYRVRGLRRSYLMFVGPNDGYTTAVTNYARGDMWFLRYKTGSTPLAAEIDDGYPSSGGGTEAKLDNYVNGESLVNQDLVIWYHATVTHSPTTNSFMCAPNGYGVPGRNILTGDKVVGPDIVPDGF